GELIELARQRAAEVLEVDAADLEVDLGLAGLAVRGTPGAGVTFAQLAESEPLLVRTRFAASAPTFPFGAHLAVVEVDVESGKAGTIGSTPAVQNAVVDAVAHLGVRHIDMPCTPMRVWQAVQQAQGGSN